MVRQEASTKPKGTRLGSVVRLGREKVLNPDAGSLYGGIQAAKVVLVILAAGRGTRFGQQPKCIQRVRATPLARHSIDAFRCFSVSPVVCLVGYRHEEVAAALGEDNLYVRSDNSAAGTAYAAFEALSAPSLLESNPVLIITMGDRIVTPRVFRRLVETHRSGYREADLTLLTAVYQPPKNRGKGRVVRDPHQRVVRIVEQRDIDAVEDAVVRRTLHELTEGNCPLYAIRAATLHGHLQELSNENAQAQFYLTDIVEAISREGGDIRTVTTLVADPEYDLLTSDVTRPMDLALLESIVTSAGNLLLAGESDVEEAARMITADRSAVQVAAIARQARGIVGHGGARETGIQARSAGGRRHCGRPLPHRLHAPGYGPLLRSGVANGHRGGPPGGRGADCPAGAERRRPANPPLSHECEIP